MHLLSSKTISKRNPNVHKQLTVEKGHWLYQVTLWTHNCEGLFVYLFTLINFYYISIHLFLDIRKKAFFCTSTLKWHEPRQLSNDIGIEEKNSCNIVIKMYVGKLSNFLFLISLLISISFHNPKSSKVSWRADKHWCVDILSPM